MLVKSLFRSNPVDIAREMDRLFDSMMSSQPYGFTPTIRAQWAYPPINLWEDEEYVYAEAELPGMTMDNIEVLVTDDELTIKGNRNIETPESGNPLRRERPAGAFERTLTLPVPIDAEGAEAKLANGVLSIALPKAAQAKPRRIEVKTNTNG